MLDSIVFGLGKVILVLEKACRLDGYFVFEVEYINNKKVHYTEDGRPGWCKDINKCIQTTHYKHEINFDEVDTKVERKILKRYQIDKSRDEYTLEMMSPAGGWIDASLMPDVMVDTAIDNMEYHLFRKSKVSKI